MTVITITRKAKCKDCRYCKYFFIGKRKKHKCSNPRSDRYGVKYGEKTITLNDLVCDKWEL